MNISKVLVFNVLLILLIFLAISCSLTKRQTSEEYYLKLREDTAICSLPELLVDSLLLKELNKVIYSWENCRYCSQDPHPFLFEIEEQLSESGVSYTITVNASPKLISQLYKGAFQYKEHLFAVYRMSETNSSFSYRKGMIDILFCDRIHSTKCGLEVKFVKMNKIYKNFVFRCEKRKIYKIR